MLSLPGVRCTKHCNEVDLVGYNIITLMAIPLQNLAVHLKLFFKQNSPEALTSFSLKKCSAARGLAGCKWTACSVGCSEHADAHSPAEHRIKPAVLVAFFVLMYAAIWRKALWSLSCLLLWRCTIPLSWYIPDSFYRAEHRWWALVWCEVARTHSRVVIII